MAEITVDYSVLADSRREHIERDAATVTVVLKCAWSDRIRLAREFLGYTAGSRVFWPHPYDTETDKLYNIYAHSVDIEPIAKMYQEAKVTVNYRNFDQIAPPSPYDVNEGALGDLKTVWVSESLEPATEFMTLQNEKLYWTTGAGADDELTAAEMPSKLLRMTDWVYTLYRIPFLPSEIFTLPGKINASSCYSRSLNFTFPAQTLLCGNPSMSREMTSAGLTAWTVTFRFTYRNNGTIASPNGWNHFVRTKATGASITWSNIYDASDNVRTVYDLADFATIII